MLHMPDKVKTLAANSLIVWDEPNENFAIVDEGKNLNDVTRRRLAATLIIPDFKAALLELDQEPGLRQEFKRLSAALQAAHPVHDSFAIHLPDFQDRSIEQSLHSGLSEWISDSRIVPLPALAEDIKRTWDMLTAAAFAADESAQLTLHLETQAMDEGKGWHKDTAHRPPDSAVAIRWFDGQTVPGFALSGTFTKASRNGKVLLHDVNEARIPSGSDFAVYKPEEVIHAILPVQEEERWSYTITGRLAVPSSP